MTFLKAIEFIGKTTIMAGVASAVLSELNCVNNSSVYYETLSMFSFFIGLIMLCSSLYLQEKEKGAQNEIR